MSAVRSIELRSISLPLVRPFLTSFGTSTEKVCVLVRVETDAGIHGWGEGFGFTLVETTKDAIDRLIGPACIGQDARDIAGLTRLLARRFHNFGRNGPVTFGISAIDIALWDIRAKAEGKPLHALLGTAARREVANWNARRSAADLRNSAGRACGSSGRRPRRRDRD